jgi:hypothetical protein
VTNYQTNLKAKNNFSKNFVGQGFSLAISRLKSLPYNNNVVQFNAFNLIKLESYFKKIFRVDFTLAVNQ